MRTLVFDMETNNLLREVTKVHCISAQCMETQETYHWAQDNLEYGIKELQKADVLVGHNITGFDIPALRKLYPSLWSYRGEFIDTMLLGCILYPEDRILSLETWAKKLHLKQQKVEHKDWSTYSPEMKIRCDSDVVINVAAYLYLLKHPEYEMTHEALKIEQSVLSIHSQQAVTGVSFDIQNAVLLYEELNSKAEAIREKIIEMAPKTVFIPGVAKCSQEEERKERLNTVEHLEKQLHDQGVSLETRQLWLQSVAKTVKPFKSNGSYTLATKKYFLNGYQKVRGPYSKIEIQELNPDADQQVKDLLLSLGWVPTEWNFKKGKDNQFVQDASGQRIPTSPKLTEDSYMSLPPGLGTTVVEYNMLCHRRSFLLNKNKDKGALISVRDRGDGRVSADAFTCGTNTGRYRHSGTVCNIPRPTSPYGKEIRSLFRATPGKWFVGVDLSGIEVRCLAWYLVRGNYSKAKETAALILSPDKGNDFHTSNAKHWNVSRDTAKSGLYALCYGCGAKKLATTLGKPEKEGAKLKKSFYLAHPGIEELINDLETAFSQRKYIKGIDGRPLYIRSKTKLLNTLLQGTAAVVFKRWMIALAEITPPNIHQEISMHDEIQWECDTEEEAIAWGKVAEDMATTIGVEMGSPIKIEAVAMVGKSWGDCH